MATSPAGESESSQRRLRGPVVLAFWTPPRRPAARAGRGVYNRGVIVAPPGLPGDRQIPVETRLRESSDQTVCLWHRSLRGLLRSECCEAVKESYSHRSATRKQRI